MGAGIISKIFFNSTSVVFDTIFFLIQILSFDKKEPNISKKRIQIDPNAPGLQPILAPHPFKIRLEGKFLR
jgi:hypothetical protein